MRNIIFIIIISILIFTSLSNADLIKDVVGYYPSWFQNNFLPSLVDYEGLTHFIHCFIGVDSLGNIEIPDVFLNSEINQNCQQNDVVLLVSLGGETFSENLSTVLANPQYANNLKTDLLNFCLLYDYDGVDIDWEFPSNEEDKQNLNTFIQSLYEVFNLQTPPLLISIAGPGSQYWTQYFDLPFLNQYVDLYNVMSYNYHGSWSSVSGHNAPLNTPSPLQEGSFSETLLFYQQSGLNMDNVVMGVSFIGIYFHCENLYESFFSSVIYDYWQVELFYNDGWTTEWDPIAEVPYKLYDTGVGLISFDDTLSIAAKCDHILSEDCGGIMIWALGKDCLNQEQLLFPTVKEKFSSSQIVEESMFMNKTDMVHIYPNPSRSFFYIDLKNIDEPCDIEIFNIKGQIIRNEHLSNGSLKFFDLNSNDVVPNGIYFVKIIFADRHLTRKVLIIR